MLTIQTNVNSLVAQQNLNVNNAFQSKTIQQLTSGYRINQSGDDAAGLAVANKFRSSTAELTQGVANGNDAAAQLQIMDGGLNNIAQILDRLKTLATQSASGTFTGSRATLNSEFQTDLGEIDRQAQSIGLNSGGFFAKSLDVYMGAGSGSLSVSNGIVTVGLTQSAVDSQALGMKGLQAIAGTVGTTDIGANSTNSVALIVANTTNTGSEATAGHASFYFSGAGFSDANAVQVSVNLSGVSDTASLVTAMNSAIAAAGTNGSQAGAAFGRAGIVGSVNTDSTGKQQLAFTSSTSAFQVQAGDRIANALMGNLVGTTAVGTALAATVTGTATAGTGVTFAPANSTVTVRIQGAAMSSPVDLALTKTSTLDLTVGATILDLAGQVTASTALKAAGITMSGGTAGAPIVFSSASGESISVMATGDTTNQLGLGAMVAGAGQANAVTYSTITGASTNTGTAVSGQSSLQISLNGAAAVDLGTLNLTGGDATAASITSATFGPGTAVVTGVSDRMNFSVDGIAVSAQLTANIQNAQATGSGTPFTGGASVNLHSAYGAAVVSTTVTSHDFRTNSSTFTVNVDGRGPQTVTLSGNDTTGTAYAADIGTQIQGVTITSTATTVTITSNTLGQSGSSLTIADGQATQAQVVGSGAVSATDNTGANNRTIAVTTHDNVLANVTLTRHDYTASDYVEDINFNNGSAPVGFHAALVNGNVAIISDDGTKGSTLSTITIATGTTGTTATLSNLGLTAVAGVHGNDAALANYAKLATGTVNGTDGNNMLEVSSDLLGPHLVTITAAASAAGTSYNAAAFISEFNSDLQAVGLNNSAAGATPTTGISTTVSGTGNLQLTSLTNGTTSMASVAAAPTNSALGVFGAALAGTYHGGAATASTVATDINNAINAALSNAGANVAGDASATAVANANGTITITNGNKGADHTISDLSTSTATFKGANAVVAGANRSGADQATYLNGLFAANTTLAPAQLTAIWTGTAAGTLTVASGNGTNFRINSGTTATAGMTTTTTALPGGGIDFAANAGARQAFQISVDDGAFTDIVLSATTTTAQGVVDAINARFTALGVAATATLSGSYIKLASNTVGAGAAIQVANMSAADVSAGYSNALAAGKILAGLTTGAVTSDQDLGFGISGASFTGTAATHLTNIGAPANHMLDAGGASSLDLTDATTHLTNAVSFSALQYGNDSQAITLTANDGSGNQQSLTVTLKNNSAAGANTAGSNIDQAISYINAQLQQSNNATLQKIVTVKENNGSTNQINFISSLTSFNVGVGSTGNADGVNGGVSNNYAVGVVGAGANMAIDTQAGAQAAVTAVGAAVGKLGSAQAAVGKGENQLAYSISLAQSQITNLSAAESYIRDANVAQQAANLTKAQVLQQASIAAMAQANSAPQAVLALLRG